MTTYLITGVSRGIGLQLLKTLASDSKNTVIGTVRNESKAEVIKALGFENVKLIYIDMGDSLEAFESAFKVLPELAPNGIDVVIHNAAITTNNVTSTVLEHDFNDYEKLFNINTLGSIKLYRAVGPFLQKQSKPFKFVFISSIASSISALPIYTNSYGISKVALNYFVHQLANELKPSGNIAIAMHPGVVETDMMAGYEYPGILSTAQSADGILKVVDGLTTDDTGKLWSYDGLIIPY